MKKLLLLLLSTLSLAGQAQWMPFQNENSYQVFLNLNQVQDDRLPVQMVTPLVSGDSVEFHLPRIIPGTYAVANYGRFVQDLQALDGEGKALPVRRIDHNRWMIGEAQSLYKIRYEVDDSYDTELKHDIFEPAGTSIEDSVYLLNNFGFIGYLKGFKDMTYRLEVAKPSGFYGSTALQGELGDTLDSYVVDNYFEVHDNPMMYCRPDTATRMVGGAEVLVSVYSPSKLVNAEKSMADIDAVLRAASVYLGGELPVEKYAVLIYCVPVQEAASSYGALEHHRSTVLYMPEFGGEEFYSGVRDITSHEFFHIITPLRIHSEMVADFNFIDPEMSEHIWFYEGVTEYNSHLVQVRNDIYTLEEFLALTSDKMNTADEFNEDIPLTVASRFTLEFLRDQYYDFYQKGHLAGMALDLKLIQLSDGEYRLVDLLRELGDAYGTDTFFVDDSFFDIITEKTYPEMREFFALHYEGAVPFPFEELLAEVGINYQESVPVEAVTLGGVDFDYNFATDRLLISDVSMLDEFGRALGWQVGDEIIAVNGRELSLDNMSDVFSEFLSETKPGEKVSFTVARPNSDDDYDTEKLKARAVLGYDYMFHVLEPMPEASEGQLRLRRVWINQ